MRAFVGNHKMLAATIISVALLVTLVDAWSASAPLRGRMAARSDVRHRQYNLLVYGLPPAWRPEYSRLLKEKYGIETRTVAFCIVSETSRSYADSYDEISTAAANRKFGHNVFKECAEAAQKSQEP